MKDENLEIEDEAVTLVIEQADHDEFKRLDQYLAAKIKDLSRNFIKTLFENGNVTSDIKLELKKMPPVGTEIDILIPPPMPSQAEPENIPLQILFEDEHLAIVNKPAGMVTHPAPGNYTGTLVNAILYHCKDIKGIGDEKRPGIVHRLDKGTSGVMVVAKDHKTHEGLVTLFSKHDIIRKYEALITGTTPAVGGKLESNMGRHPIHRLKMAANVSRGKKAITHYRLLKSFGKLHHVECRLETGRTHQIRVHLSELVHRAILCDSTYGRPGDQLAIIPPEVKPLAENYPYPFLHAKSLGFIHPITKQELYFEAEPPAPFKTILEMFPK